MSVSVDANDGRRSFGTLLRELAEGGTTLVRDEVRMARVELADVARSIGKGTGFVAVGGVLALLGSLSLLTGIVLLIGDQWLPRDLYWVAALIFVIITGAVALFFVRKGQRHLSPQQLTPDQTVATLKEDKEWLKQQLTSGATSR
ncbi:MAG: phage holin family protein [Gemmatimonadaceae bacterium]|nr:phage holin family protein [Gemmatimonadaceae bacterium]